MSTKPQTITLKKRPWHNLCDLQGLQGVIAEWGVFPQSLLQITNNRAQALPCGKSCGCYMNVVSHNDEYVGICTSEPRRCDRRILTKAETIIYRLNTNELFKKIVEVTLCDSQVEVISGLPNFWKIGCINPKTGYSFPVYVSLSPTSASLNKAVNHLSLKTENFLLIAPLGSLFSHESLNAAQAKKSKLVGLDDLLEIADGTVKAKGSAKQLLDSWLEPLFPAIAWCDLAEFQHPFLGRPKRACYLHGKSECGCCL